MNQSKEDIDMEQNIKGNCKNDEVELKRCAGY